MPGTVFLLVWCGLCESSKRDADHPCLRLRVRLARASSGRECVSEPCLAMCDRPGLFPLFQGAGGNGNVLKEIVEPAGATYDIRKVLRPTRLL